MSITYHLLTKQEGKLEGQEMDILENISFVVEDMFMTN